MTTSRRTQIAILGLVSIVGLWKVTLNDGLPMVAMAVLVHWASTGFTEVDEPMVRPVPCVFWLKLSTNGRPMTLIREWVTRVHDQLRLILASDSAPREFTPEERAVLYAAKLVLNDHRAEIDLNDDRLARPEIKDGWRYRKSKNL
jgi:hypothetical protein